MYLIYRVNSSGYRDYIETYKANVFGSVGEKD